MPVAGVYLLGVLFLLVDIGFIGNVKNSIEENLAEAVTFLTLWLFMSNSHFLISLFEYFQFSLHLFPELPHHFLLSPNGSLLIQFTSLVITSLTQFSVLCNHVLALICSPLFVLKFFFLLGLSLHSLNNLLLFAFLVHFNMSFRLIDYHLSASALTLLSSLISHSLLILGLQTCGG